MRRVLLIAFHYPPAKGSSGIHRTLAFSRYLAENGWHPIVLSANPVSYPTVSEEQLGEIPDDIVVKRAFALDTARHLAIHGRYPGFLACPDRWATWWAGGTCAALRLVHKYRPSVVWSTFPIATAHLIGLTVSRLTSLPWVADFRDSMTEIDYPVERARYNAYRWIERRTINTAACAVFTAPGAIEMYAARYPEVDRSKLRCILNGYDENAFADATAIDTMVRRAGEKKILLHSGILYPHERNPTAFFSAIQILKGLGEVSADKLEIRFRATGYDEMLSKQIGAYGVQDIVKLMPPVDYVRALKEMMQADGLLIFQAANCNHQIPAKLYEYIRAGTPILALADQHGDTASLLKAIGVPTIAPLDSRDDIVLELRRFLSMLANGSAPVVSSSVVEEFSRRSQTSQLAEIFDALRVDKSRPSTPTD